MFAPRSHGCAPGRAARKAEGGRPVDCPASTPPYRPAARSDSSQTPASYPASSRAPGPATQPPRPGSMTKSASYPQRRTTGSGPPDRRALPGRQPRRACVLSSPAGLLRLQRDAVCRSNMCAASPPAGRFAPASMLTAFAASCRPAVSSRCGAAARRTPASPRPGGQSGTQE